jgi:hypothetical protein
MNKICTMIILSGLLITAPLFAQGTTEEHKHEDHQSAKPAPAEPEKSPTKADAMKCCEAMEKNAGSKEGAPAKSEMKAKMEKMKEKMAEKMKETKGSVKTAEPEKETHQH